MNKIYETVEKVDQSNFIFIDIETTGLFVGDIKPQIVSFAAVDRFNLRFERKIVKPSQPYYIDPKAQSIHGLSKEVIEQQGDAPSFVQVWRDFITWTDQVDMENLVIVSYNGFKFDFEVIVRELHGESFTEKQIFLNDVWYDLHRLEGLCVSLEKYHQVINPKYNEYSEHQALRDCYKLRRAFNSRMWKNFKLVEFRLYYHYVFNRDNLRLFGFLDDWAYTFTLLKNCCLEQLSFHKTSYDKVQKKQFCWFRCYKKSKSIQTCGNRILVDGNNNNIKQIQDQREELVTKMKETMKPKLWKKRKTIDEKIDQINQEISKKTKQN